ncbi:MAG TPA: xanthine dehydrogenase family protein subunit M [Candidatus Caldiarchaeum subterraneum]|uniref:Xanthine dehydrogenase family protein subunit M n=1 Tax=Caldiarchaeum subterraneum TaxID=311458 RepID=A0A832ZWU5_CALS0|nr:xanthine dehydrogenase family protein subunit M [Aigarchaeota archaeon]HIQ30311.1 xanthine dehydrogenase family protein subunit M [Candidatus Caldarchaeum subterraneum]
MYVRSFQYLAPKTVKEAVTLLNKLGGEAKVIAGGQSLVPLMKLRLATPSYLIDLNRVKGLDYIKDQKNRILIGALTRHAAIENSDLIKEHVPIMAEAASHIADPQVRNLGTIGGSLAHCDPAGDWGAVVIALNGEVKITGPRKDRVMKIDDFFIDTYQPNLKKGEILTEVRIPKPQPNSGGAYLKLERRAGDFATAGVAAQLTLDVDGVCRYAGIGLTALGPTSLRARKAEKTLLGRKVDDNSIEEAAEAAAEESKPTDDPLRGSAEYKRAMARVLTRRALKLALARATGGGA